MRLGISTASFFNRISTEMTFDILRQMHVDTTEVYLNTFAEYEKPFIDALVSKRGMMNVHSVHPRGIQFETELFSPNLRVRADAENIFKKICYSGFMLGAKFYTFHGPIKLHKKDYAFDYVKLGERVNQLIEIALSYGVRLSYQNSHYAYGSSPDYFKQLLRYCPQLFASLDVKQAVWAGYDPVKFLDAMEGRISTFHLWDMKKDFSSCMPGEGIVKFEKFISEVVSRSINVNMIVEANSKDFKDINQLKTAYDYLNTMLVRIINS